MSSNAQGIQGQIIATARIEANPGKADELAQWIANLKARADSEQEPGTLVFNAARSGDHFAVFEKYASYEALKAHQESNPLFRDFAKVRDTLAKNAAPTFWPVDSLPKPTVL